MKIHEKIRSNNAHECLIAVNEILHKHKVGGMTFYDVKGRGRTKYESIAAGRA
jgi:nitrogen regulatory protein P-II 1